MSFALAIFLGMTSPVKKNGKSLKSQAKIVRNAVIYLSEFKAYYYYFFFKVSVPIYTLGPNKKQHEKYFKNLKDQQLAPNIYYLGL